MTGIGKEAVEKMAVYYNTWADDMRRYNGSVADAANADDTADTIRAQAARIAELEAQLATALDDGVREAAEVARSCIPTVGPEGPTSNDHLVAYEQASHTYLSILALLTKEPKT